VMSISHTAAAAVGEGIFRVGRSRLGSDKTGDSTLAYRLVTGVDEIFGTHTLQVHRLAMGMPYVGAPTQNPLGIGGMEEVAANLVNEMIQ
jgi:hypothetical protein